MRWLVLLLIPVSAIADEITYRQHSYESGHFTVARPFADVKTTLLAGLADYTAQDAYARYDAGATREDFTGGNPAGVNTERKPYKVYDVRWEVPIFIDTGKRKEVYRIGLGGGPGRSLIGTYPEAGLHVLPAVHLWGEGDKTRVFFIKPSSQYANAYPDSPEMRALGQQADERLLKLLNSLSPADER